jgi:mRNA interferase RelE/StbE
MHRVEFTPTALKDLQKLPRSVQKRIIKKIEFFLSSGRPLAFAHGLINSELGQYRFRISDYRVIFDLEEETLVVLKIGHRKNIYK